MKFKKFFPIFMCSLLVAGGSLLAIQSVSHQAFKEARADTDCGTVAFDFATDVNSPPVVYHGNQYSGDNLVGIYLAAPSNSIPFETDWSLAWHPVNKQGGLFINGVDQGNANLNKHGANSYYLDLNLTPAQAGAIVTLTGTWTAVHHDVTYTFTVSPSFELMWDGLSMEYVHETFSLMDCGYADSIEGPFEKETGYWSENLYQNAFGLPNPEDSFALQFYFKASGEMDGTLTVRIGSNVNYDAGHVIHFDINNTWGPNGTIAVKEFLNNAVYGGNQTEGATNLKDGETHLIELGVVRIPNSTDYSVYAKNDGRQVFREAWELDETTERTSRVGLCCGATNVSITNSIDANKVGTNKLIYINTVDKALFFYHQNNIEPNAGWEFMAAYSDDNLMLNGVSLTSGKTLGKDYFKKTGIRDYYFNLDALYDVSTLKAGDLLKIGGTFKLVHSAGEGVWYVYKIALANSYFEYNGTDWVGVDPSYTAAKFAKDLLKQTLPVCSAHDDNNGAALADIWEALAGADYYGKLPIAEKEELGTAVVDSVTSIPATAELIDAMDDDDAIGVALYHYERLTVKYSLSEFITGRTLVPATNQLSTINDVSSNMVVIIMMISIATILFIASGLYLNKRKQDR